MKRLKNIVLFIISLFLGLIFLTTNLLTAIQLVIAINFLVLAAWYLHDFFKNK